MRAVKRALAGVLAFLMVLVLLPQMAAAADDAVCQFIGEAPSSFNMALEWARAYKGGTIKLLADINYDTLYISGMALTFDLNGHKLNIVNNSGVTGSWGLRVTGTGSSVNITGSGEFNVTCGVINGAGVSVDDGGRATLTNATATGARATAAYATSGGSITLKGNAVASNFGSQGAFAMDSGSVIEVYGDVINNGSGTECVGVEAMSGGKVTVHKNVASAGKGVYIEGGGDVDIGGNVVLIGGSGYGVYTGSAPSATPAKVVIDGNLTVNPGATGIYSVQNGLTKVSGQFTAPAATAIYLGNAYITQNTPVKIDGKDYLHYTNAGNHAYLSFTSAVINPSTLTFDRTYPQDVSATVTWNSAGSVTAVKAGGTALNNGTDYTVSGNTLTIYGNYLKNQPAGTLVLTVEFDKSAPVAINVIISAGAALNPDSLTFDKSNPQNVSTTVTFNSAASVTAVKAGGTALNKGTDYTMSGMTLTIYGSYLMTRPTGTLALTVEFDKGAPAALNITISLPEYTVTYNANGGGGTIPTEGVKVPGATFTAANNTLTAPAGKKFKEWNTALNGSGTAYAPGATVTMPGNALVLYAIWRDATPTECVDEDFNALTWDSIRNSNVLESDVKTALSLRTAGANGTTITWTASPTGVINPSTGEVTRQLDGDKAVTLTATVSYPGATSRIKTFNLTVPATSGKFEAENALITAAQIFGGAQAVGASGGQQVGNLSVANSSSVQWNNLPKCQTVEIRYATMNPTGKISLYKNNVHVKDVNFTPTGGWFGVGCFKSLWVPLEINSGDRLKIQYDSGDTVLNLDYIACYDFLIQNASLNPTSVTFDKTYPANASATVTWNNAGPIADIKAGGTSIGGSNYSVSGDTLSINSTYLASKSLGDLALTVEFAKADPAALTVKIIESASLAPTTGAFDKSYPADVTATVDWKSASSVTDVKVDGVSIGTANYGVVGNVLTIQQRYFSGRASGSLVLSVEFNKGAPAALTVTVSESATLSPVVGAFDKNPANRADVTTAVTWHDASSVSDVRAGNTSIGLAYFSVADGILTIKKEYLATTAPGSLVLTVVFDKGAPAELTITVSPENASISPVSQIFDKDTPSNVFTDITWHDARTVTDVKAGENTIGSTNFGVSGTRLTIQQGYLASQTAGYHVLTVLFDKGASATFTIIITAKSARINPVSGTFDKDPLKQADFTTVITWNDASSVTDVKAGGNSIGKGNYTVSDNILTIKKEYLAERPTGDFNMTVEFNNGLEAMLRITILRANASINPVNAAFDKNPANQADVTTAITWNEARSVTTVKKGMFSILPENFNVVGNTLTISKDYLAKSTVGSLVLTVVFDNNEQATLTITITDTTPVITAALSPASAALTAGVGYTTQPAQQFSVINTGTGAVTNLTAALGGGNFEISAALSATSINVGGTATLSVRPKTELPTGTYTDILTVTGDNGITLTAGLSFTVSEQTAVVGDFVVTSGFGTGYVFADNVLTFNTSGSYTVSLREGITSTAQTIAVLASGTSQSNPVSITLNGVRIVSTNGTAFDIQAGHVRLTLAEGTLNSFTSGMINAGIYVVGSTTSLAIDAQGSGSTAGVLTAHGGHFGGAGIGGQIGMFGGTVIINGGNITAIGGSGGGAGIGGGSAGSGGTVTIRGGTVTAQGYGSGAGIGAGSGGSSPGTVTIAPAAGFQTAVSAGADQESSEPFGTFTAAAPYTGTTLNGHVYFHSITTPLGSAAILPVTGSFDKGAPANVSTAILWNGASEVTDVTAAGSSIGSGNYNVSGNTLTVYQTYLAAQDTGSLVLTVVFNNGGEATLTITVTGSAPVISVAISPTSTTFTAAAAAGYTTQPAQQFYVINTGTGAVASLAAALGGENFEISAALSAASVNAGGTVTLSVRPKTGLLAGTYTDTLTVTGDGGVSLTANLSFTVEPPAFGVQAEYVRLAYDGDNNRYLAVNTLRDSADNYSLIGRFLSPDGTPLGDPFTVAEGLEDPYADVAYDSVGKRFLVVYENTYYDEIEEDDYDRIYACFIESDGTAGDSFPIAADEGCNPSVAAGGGKFLVAYEYYNSVEDGYRIYGRMIDGGGTPGDSGTPGASFQISGDSVGHDYDPSAAYDGAGHFLVAYRRSTHIDIDRIYGKIIDINNPEAGSEFLVSEGQIGDCYSPSVVSDEKGAFLVAYGNDYVVDDDWYNVLYARRVGADQALGSAVPLRSVKNGLDFFYPRLAYSAAHGVLLTVWDIDSSDEMSSVGLLATLAGPLGDPFPLGTGEDPAAASDGTNFLAGYTKERSAEPKFVPVVPTTQTYDGPLYFKVGSGENKFYYGDPESGGTPAVGLTGWSFAGGVLTLDGLVWNTTARTALTIVGGDLTIRLADGSANAFISSFSGSKANNNTFGIYTEENLTIVGGTAGTGSLTAAGGVSPKSESTGISTGMTLQIKGGSVTASGGIRPRTDTGKFCYGLRAGSVVITGGTVNAAAADGKTSSFGIFSFGDVTISGGAVYAVSGQASGGGTIPNLAGISAGIGTMIGTVSISGGTVTAGSAQATNLSIGIGAYAGSIQISGGTVAATASLAANPAGSANSDGISAGLIAANVTISGGIVTATAGQAPDVYGVSGGVMANSHIVVSGGTVTAAGDREAFFSYIDEVSVTADYYQYWTNKEATETGADGPIYNYITPFDNLERFEYVKIVPVSAPTLPYISTGYLPDGTVGTAYSQTLAAVGITPITWSQEIGSLPGGLTINSEGVISGTPTTAGTFNFTIKTQNTAGSDTRELTITIADSIPNPTAPSITTETLPGGTVGTAYSQTLAATGDTLITWSLADGSNPLPGGLTLSNGGVISGTPTTAGTFSFTVKADNNAGSDTQALSITIDAAPVAPSITTEILPGGTVGTPYSQTLAATGDTPITWSLTDGSNPLPGGLTLSSGGVISGTPTAAGTFSFTVKADNNAGSDTQALSITIDAAPVAPSITTETLPGGTVDTAYNQTLAATGDAPITWSTTDGNLPGGLTINSEGVISGTPTTAGTFTFTVEAVNATGSDTQELSITINAAPVAPSITTETLPGGMVGTAYSQTLAAAGDTLITWSLADGSNPLPGGLTLSNGGVISGTPTTAGTFNFTVKADNNAGNDTQSLSITIDAAPVAPSITTETLPGGTVGAAYSQTLAATGDTLITWSLADGSNPLPGGLTLSNGGVISGTPTAAGTFSFTVKADNNAGSDTQVLSITIDAAPVAPSITTETLPGGTAGTPYSQTLAATGDTPVTWSLADGSNPLPGGLTLSTSGVISGTPTTAGTFSFTVKADNNAGSDTQALSITINAAPVAPSITTETLPGGTAGTPYSQTLAATGDTLITWSLADGSNPLPGGLTLSNGGVISGTPTTAGTFSFTVKADNNAGSDTQALSITINAAPVAPSINTETLPGGTVGTVYNQTLTVTGDAPITWILESGNLPGGLTLTSDGIISGTPTTTGTFSFTVKAENTTGNDTQALSITISAAPVAPSITTEILPGGTVGTPYSQTLAATGDTPITWSLTDGSNPLPGGLTLSSGGVISGIPTMTGTFSFTVKAGNNAGSDTKTLSITINTIPTYHLTINAGIGGRIITGSNGNYTNGTIIFLAASANVDYSFNKWTSVGGGSFADANNANTTFTMPANSVTITAEFTYHGGGGSIPVIITYNAEIREGGVKTDTLPVTINGSTGTASLGAAKTAALFAAGNASVVMPPIPGVGAYTLELPASELDAGFKTGALTLSTGFGSVTIPDHMLGNLTGMAGKTAGITIAQGDTSGLTGEERTAVGNRPLVQLSLTLDGQKTPWHNPGAPMTVTIPYTPTAEELINPESILIWYLDGSGKPICVPNGHYDAATGTVTFQTTHFSFYAVGYNPVSFRDVAPGAWYGRAVTFIGARGITAGTGNGNYSPEAKLTRGEFIVLLMRAYGIAPDINPINNFSDAGNTYYTNYLAAAKRLGITNGIGNNMFAPGREITRQEMFTLLHNALRILGQLPQGNSGRTLYSFSDADQIDFWAKDAMGQLVEAGVIGGSGGKLNPTATTTRAEMAQVLYNLLTK